MKGFTSKIIALRYFISFWRYFFALVTVIFVADLGLTHEREFDYTAFLHHRHQLQNR